jgi:hypothetical protein
MLYFFSGVLTTLLFTAILLRYKKFLRNRKIVIRQSYLFELVKRFLPEEGSSEWYLEKLYTQSMGHEDNKAIKYIELSDKKAYWIEKNKVYYTDMSNGHFDPSGGKLLETNDISEEQVSKILFIVNSLKRG